MKNNIPYIMLEILSNFVNLTIKTELYERLNFSKVNDVSIVYDLKNIENEIRVYKRDIINLIYGFCFDNKYGLIKQHYLTRDQNFLILQRQIKFQRDHITAHCSVKEDLTNAKVGYIKLSDVEIKNTKWCQDIINLDNKEPIFAFELNMNVVTEDGFVKMNNKEDYEYINKNKKIPTFYQSIEYDLFLLSLKIFDKWYEQNNTKITIKQYFYPIVYEKTICRILSVENLNNYSNISYLLEIIKKNQISNFLMQDFS